MNFSYIFLYEITETFPNFYSDTSAADFGIANFCDLCYVFDED